MSQAIREHVLEAAVSAGPNNAGAMPKYRSAVLIPCRNEGVSIGKVVADFRRVLPDAVVYVYDNNSVDAVTLLRSGEILQAVALPAGRSTVPFRFAPPHIGVGWLCLAAAVLGLAWQAVRGLEHVRRR